MHSPMVFSTHLRGWHRTAALAASLAFAFGCATGVGLPSRVAYDYFEAPAANDPWTGKIQRWQERERNDVLDPSLPAVSPGPASVADGGDGPRNDVPVPASLHEKYESFRAERKRAQARDVAEWIQSQARDHYVPDGPIDRWATFAETMRENGDDCDGLELLTFHMLRELGFAEDEVFRAIVYRRNDGQHHMVTLWFEDANDPWVIDPTGAMTTGMPRMSQVPGWVPLKVFSIDANYSVERSRTVASR